MALNKAVYKVALAGFAVTSLAVSPVVLAEGGAWSQFVQGHKSEVLRVSEEYGLLPSVVMSKYILSSQFGTKEFDLESWAKDLYTSGTSAGRLLTETASKDEAVALLFSDEYTNSATFVADMNGLLSTSDISGLDAELYGDGLKPIFHYADMADAIETGKQSEEEPFMSVPLDSDSFNFDKLSKESIQTDVTIRNLAYKEPKQLDLLSNGANNKSWWQFWKSGYLESDFKVLKSEIEVPALVRSVAEAEVEYFKMSDIVSGSFYETSHDGIYAFGSSNVKALVNTDGRLIGLWSSTLKQFDGFGDYGQIVDTADGFVTLGYRVGNLIDTPLLGVESVSDFEMTEDLERSLIAVKETKPSKMFFFHPLYKNLYLVNDGDGYLVVDSDWNEIGTSSDMSGDSSYTRIKTEVGDLWLRY